MARKKLFKKDPASVPVSAPRPPAPTDGRPTLKESRATARATLKTGSETRSRPGEVVNGEGGLVYYYWDALEVDEARQIKLRLLLESRGYWKSKGSEYVPGVPHAEVWATYVEVKAELDRETKRRHDRMKKAVSGKV